MKTVRVINETKQIVLGDRVGVADTLWSRGRGLMLRDALPPGTGLLIEPCSSIHTMWMRFPIDVLYVRRDGTIARVASAMRPWRLGPLLTGARYVIEFPAGVLDATRTEPGDRVSVFPAAS